MHIYLDRDALKVDYETPSFGQSQGLVKETVRVGALKNNALEVFHFHVIADIARQHPLMEIIEGCHAVLQEHYVTIDKPLYVQALNGTIDPVHLLQTESYDKKTLFEIYDALSLFKKEGDLERLVSQPLKDKNLLSYFLMSVLEPNDKVYKECWDKHHDWFKNQQWDVELMTGLGHIPPNMFLEWILPIALQTEEFTRNFQSIVTSLCFERKEYLNLSMTALWDKSDQWHPSLLPVLQKKIIQERIAIEPKLWVQAMIALRQDLSHYPGYEELVKHYSVLFELRVPYAQLEDETTTCEVELYHL